MFGMDYQAPVNTIHIGAVDASTAPVVNVFQAPCPCTVRAIYLVNGLAIAAHATNCHISTIKRLRAAAPTTVAAQSTCTATSGYAAIAADVPWLIPLVSNALAVLQPGDILQWMPTEVTAAYGDLTEAAIVVIWIPGTGESTG
jgi:hypothetical protein